MGGDGQRIRGRGSGWDDIDSMDSGLTVGCPSNTTMELGLRSPSIFSPSIENGLGCPPLLLAPTHIPVPDGRSTRTLAADEAALHMEATSRALDGKNVNAMSSFYRGGDAGRRANFLKTCSRSSAICRLTECSGGCDEVGPSRFEALLAVRAEREHRDAAKSVARTERTPRFPWALGAGDDRTLKPIAGGVGVGHCRCGGATGVSRNPPEWADARPCMSWTFSVAFGPRLARKCRIRPTVHTARGSG